MAQTSNPTPEQQPTPSPSPRPSPHQDPAPTQHPETPPPATPTQEELDAMARGEYTAPPPEAPEAAQKRERDALEARHKREREQLERQHRDVRPAQSGPGYTTR